MDAAQAATKAKEALTRLAKAAKKNPALAVLIVAAVGVVVYLATRKGGDSSMSSGMELNTDQQTESDSPFGDLLSSSGGGSIGGASPIVETSSPAATPTLIAAPATEYSSDPGLGSFSDMSFSSLDPVSWGVDSFMPAAAAAAPAPDIFTANKSLNTLAAKTITPAKPVNTVINATLPSIAAKTITPAKSVNTVIKKTLPSIAAKTITPAKSVNTVIKAATTPAKSINTVIKKTITPATLNRIR